MRRQFLGTDGDSLFVVQGFDPMDALLLVARLVLAAVFLVSGVSKLVDLSGSEAAMRSFGIPESMSASGVSSAGLLKASEEV